MDEQTILRLQKFMSLCGVASRRKSEDMILQGKVKINGQTVKTLGAKVNIENDNVEVDGKVIYMTHKKIYIMLNKPTGFVTTVSDQFGRRTVLDLVKADINERLYPVGRLDYDTEGLLFLTNDGEFTYRMTHPSHNINKKYVATVKGVPTDEKLKQFRKGLIIDGYTTSPAKIDIIKRMKGSSELQITIHEGKNRQVRKMCDLIGYPVIKLKRIAIGNIILGNLPLGKWRHLKPSEIKLLNEITDK